ncbi:MAG: hypothetical protein KAR42_01650 [candidate division Zixibacteria bacterium]|nr:hypothetical protein [candidate division Zixibacteria bacterium]
MLKNISLKKEWVIFFAIIVIAISARMYSLNADPPQGITFSQGIETDPPQYTIFARNDILQDSWNPHGDNRFVTYQFSLISGFSRLVYGVFGAGTFQGNLTAALLSIFSLLLFYFVIRKSAGNKAALLMLFFIAINFLHIFFGRRPFLEVGMNFLFIAGLFCLAMWEKKLIGHFLWGFLTAASIVFGKVIGLAFLCAPAVYYLYKIFYINDENSWKQLLFMIAGFSICSVSWYLFIFSPNAESVAGYVGEQAFGLYGAPEGMLSFSKFFWKMTIFGKDTEFFDRMPAISIGAVAGLIVLAGSIFRKKQTVLEDKTDNGLMVAIAAWLVGIYIAQMPWNYQPLRYQISMIFPLSGLAAFAISYFINRKKFDFSNRSIIFNSLLFVFLFVLLFQLADSVSNYMGHKFYFKNYSPYVLGVVAPAVIILYLFSWKRKNLLFELPAFVRYCMVGSLVLVSLVYNVRNYTDWAKTPLFTGEQASIDLGKILTPAAVISGPFGPAMALDNSLGCVIHIFGTSRPDTLLFKKYPITHLALERSNETAAREIYPEIMNRAKKVCQYYINCRKITVFRIAYATGNPEAARYFPSSFEKSVMFYEQSNVDSGDFYIERFLRIYPDNMVANKQVAYKSYMLNDYDEAIKYAKLSIESSPTDFSLHYMLSKAYIGKASETGDDNYNLLGVQAQGKASIYNLGYIDFDDESDIKQSGENIDNEPIKE